MKAIQNTALSRFQHSSTWRVIVYLLVVIFVLGPNVTYATTPYPTPAPGPGPCGGGNGPPMPGGGGGGGDGGDGGGKNCTKCTKSDPSFCSTGPCGDDGEDDDDEGESCGEGPPGKGGPSPKKKKTFRNKCKTKRSKSGGSSSSSTDDPIHLKDGAVLESATDLYVSGPAISWTQTRHYNGALTGAADFANKWTSGNTDYTLVSSGTSVWLIYNANSRAIFTADGLGGFISPSGFHLKLVHDSGNSQYVVTDTRTHVVSIFHDFTVTNTAHRGKLKEVTKVAWRTAGSDGLLYTLDSAGEVSQIISSEGQAYSIDFTREAGHIKRIRVKEGTELLEEVEYTYRHYVSGASTDIGTTGDLVQVKNSIRDSASNWTHSYTQYRYDNSSRLKGVYHNTAIQAIISAGDTAVDDPLEILTKSDSYAVNSGTTIQNYASKWFTYYTSNESTNAIDTPFTSSTTTENLESIYGGANRNETNFVKTERVGLGTCSACGGGSPVANTYHYYYMELDQGVANDDNEVKYIVVEDIADGAGTALNRNVYGLNGEGHELREAFVDNPAAGTPKYWCQSTILMPTSQWTGALPKRYLITEFRPPSAHSVTSSNIDEFLDPYDDTGAGSWANDTAVLKTASDTTAGPITLSEYNAEGRLTALKVKRGCDDSTADFLSGYEYGNGTSVPSSYQTEAYMYPSQTTTKTNGSKWTTDYEFWDTNKTQLRKKTTTWPIIPTSENGSGVAATDEEYFDKAGRLRWIKSAEGHISYISYHAVTGIRGYIARDVDPTSLPTSASDSQWVSPTDDGDATSGYDSAGIPTRGFSSPAAIKEVEMIQFDELGRLTLTTDPDASKHSTLYQVVSGNERTVHFPYLDSNGKPQQPISITVEDELGNIIEEYSVRANYTAIATAGSPLVPTGFSTEPSQSDYVSWTRYTYDDIGRIKYIDNYHDIPSSGTGTISTNFYRTVYQYDAQDRQHILIDQVSGSPTSSGVEQVTKTIYDVIGRPIKTERGVSLASHSMGANYDTYPTLRTVSEVFYDGGDSTTPLKVGDSLQTSNRRYYGTGTNDFVQTDFKYTFRGHVRGTSNKNGTTSFGPYSVQDINWQGNATASAQYTSEPSWSSVLTGDGYTAFTTSTTNRFYWTKTHYNTWGQVYQIEQYPGTAGTRRLQFNNYYNRNGQLVCTGDRYGAHTEYAFDGVDREFQQRTVTDVVADSGSTGKFDANGAFRYRAPVPQPEFSSSNATAMTGGNDGVIELSHTYYEPYSSSSNKGEAVEQHQFEMIHTDTNGIDLTSDNDYVRRSVYTWHDSLGRVTTMADFGAGGGSTGAGSWKYNTEPTRGSAPTVSADDKLLGLISYHAETGKIEVTTDPVGIKTKRVYDDLGQRLAVAENYVNYSYPSTGIGGGTNDEQDRVTTWTYNGLGQQVVLTAHNGSSSSQATRYYYEDAVNASLLTHTVYPDSSSTPSSGSDLVTNTYNLDGSLSTMTDQRGVVHTYTYNTSLQLELDGATTIPSGVDDSVKSIRRTYDTKGRLTKITSYSDAAGSATIRNEIELTYNSIGRVESSEQSHEGVVGSAPVVTYDYDDTYSSDVYTNGLRYNALIYPLVTAATKNPQIVYNYGNTDDINDRLGRVKYFKQWSGTFTTTDDFTAGGSYQYNGTGRLVTTAMSVDGGTSTTIAEQVMGTSGDYTAFDRFGRTLQTKWYKSSTVKDQFDYTYDAAGNRLTRNIPSSLYSTDNKDQAYLYDGLHRLKDFDEGTLSGSSISGTPAREQTWTLDQMGNWSNFITKTGGTINLDQQRAHNDANEIDTNNNHADGPGASITATTGPNWSDPLYDAAGNMTTVPWPTATTFGLAAHYDAWNRLVALIEPGTSDEQAFYEYDGLNRMIVRYSGPTGVTHHNYYNEEWQVVLEAEGTSTITPTVMYSYHPHYVDAVAHRMRAGDSHTYLHDANYNVTAMLDSSAAVVERYDYTAYGEAIYLDGSFAALSTQESAIGNAILYTGRWVDPDTDLQLNRERWYHQQLGRWLSRDPIGYQGGLNLYRYVNSSPLTTVDPFGNVPVLCCTCQCQIYTGGPGMGVTTWDEIARATQSAGRGGRQQPGPTCENACEARGRRAPNGMPIRCSLKSWKECDAKNDECSGYPGCFKSECRLNCKIFKHSCQTACGAMAAAGPWGVLAGAVCLIICEESAENCREQCKYCKG